jgi:RES domain-containing protein
MNEWTSGWEPALAGNEARKLARAMQACKRLAVPWEGILFRSVKPGFASEDDLLSGLGAYRFGGRFNLPGLFPVVYASTDDETAAAEVRHYARLHGWERLLPRVLAGVEVRFTRLLDLRENSPCPRLLGLTGPVLKAEWEPIMASKREALTQIVGRLAHEAGFEGLLAPSARSPGLNLNYFPGRLDPALSFIRIINPQDLPPTREVEDKLS